MCCFSVSGNIAVSSAHLAHHAPHPITTVTAVSTVGSIPIGKSLNGAAANKC